MKKLLFASLVLFVMLTFSGCGGDGNDSPTKKPDDGKYTISYDANGFTGRGVPTTTKTVIKGQAIGKDAIPHLNNSSEHVFGGYAITPDGAPVNALFVPEGNITLYVRYSARIDEGDPVTITYNANGWLGEGVPSEPVEATSGEDIGKEKLRGIDDTDTQKFIGWAVSPAGQPIPPEFMLNSNITLYVIWEVSSGPIPEPPNNVEQILLGHGGTALYKFELLEDTVWEDYRAFAVDIKLSQRGLDIITKPNPTPADPDAVVGVRHFRLYGAYEEKTIIMAGDDRFGTLHLSMGNYNNEWIMDTSKTTDFVIENFAHEDKKTVKDEYITVLFDITGNSGYKGSGAQFGRLPNDDSTGPFWFGVGISGQEGESDEAAILQLVRNPRLVGYPGIGTAYGTKPEEGEPLFVAWNAPIVRCWRGAEGEEVVYPSLVDNFNRGEPPAKETLTTIELDPELPYQHGKGAEAPHQKGWVSDGETLTVQQLQRAWYLVLEMDTLPQGGGNLAWVQPDVDNSWYSKAAFASGSGVAAHDGVVIDTEAKTIEILLPKSLQMYGELYNGDFEGTVALVLTYNGDEGEDTAITLEDLGITRAYLLINPEELE